MEKTFCDICGEEVKARLNSTIAVVILVTFISEKKHLCKNCTKRLEKWLKKEVRNSSHA